MKQLFERFEEQSLAVEKVLERSIELVRERKSPGTELCAEIDTALRELRSVYDEITVTLPERAGGVVVPQEASVTEMQALYESHIASNQNALKAVLILTL